MASEYLKAQEVAEICNVGIAKAYKIIADANNKLAKEGKYVIRSRISRKYLYKFLGLE